MRARAAGAALITAMLTVSLVAGLAATALGHQWRNVEVETAEQSRVQALWVLTGALDWARLILREDGRSGGADHLAEPWAVPLEEARISTFLMADKTTTDEDLMQQVFLSGRISDLQGRLNVYNLVEGQRVSEPDLRVFAKLFELLGLPAAELVQLTDNLRLARDTRSEAGPDSMVLLLPQRLDQLVWLGLSPASLARLRPYITLLPVRTRVNVNTASAPVLYASIAGLDMAQAERIAGLRQISHFRTLADVGKVVSEVTGQLSESQHSVTSSFFEVAGRLRQDQTVVEERSTVRREGMNVTVLWRESGAPAAAGAPLQ
jgi:general secretion pathway protein K